MLSFFKHLVRYWWVWAALIALLGTAWLLREVRTSPPVAVGVQRSTHIDVTAEEITRLREIGQWEFLTVSTEEMVEWHRSRTFGNDHMVRIYQGRLRLGFDTRQLRPDWFRAEGDSIAHLTLPPVGLLDENFIDEARTRTFYEKGTCPPDTLERLYHTAQQRMRQRGLSARHLHDAEENARRQFTQIFQALGYRQCHITFKK